PAPCRSSKLRRLRSMDAAPRVKTGGEPPVGSPRSGSTIARGQRRAELDGGPTESPPGRVFEPPKIKTHRSENPHHPRAWSLFAAALGARPAPLPSHLRSRGRLRFLRSRAPDGARRSHARGARHGAGAPAAEQRGERVRRR